MAVAVATIGPTPETKGERGMRTGRIAPPPGEASRPKAVVASPPAMAVSGRLPTIAADLAHLRVGTIAPARLVLGTEADTTTIRIAVGGARALRDTVEDQRPTVWTFPAGMAVKFPMFSFCSWTRCTEIS